ncbi:MAG: fibronectin type III domain-containing protein [Gammaproteobacteria bacterium]|nr:fibronectin type III domain-containing protein [Gammaproteobacteria bacterium]
MMSTAGHRLGSSLRLAASAALLCGCSPAVQEPRGTVLLEWDQPPAREAAGESAVAGYTIYYWRANEGRIRRIDVPDPRRRTVEVERLAPGEYYFSMASYDELGTRSELSRVFRQVVR